jgi:indole-3-glycerol phosphate synthase
MSATYLDSIMEYHRARAGADSRRWQERELARCTRPSLAAALREHRDEGLAVIAEVKRRSPSRGWLAEGLDAATVAGEYVEGGASAVSVLTDSPHFGGALDDLVAVARAVEVPVLRKDFTVAPNDVLDALEAGASAVLVIVAALSARELEELLALATQVGIDALVEVHSLEEATRAIDVGARLVGVNQRDLRTFEVDPRRAAEVAAALPGSVVAVAESGFASPREAAEAAEAGFDAVLVGEYFVTAGNRSSTVRSFVGAPIRVRAS